MSVCHSCGQPHDAGALHCGFCGARLSQPTPNVKKTMLGMAALSLEDPPRATPDAPVMPSAPVAPSAPPAMPAMGEAAGWPDPEDWGLEDTPAVTAAPAPQALADTLEASREEVLRQIALDAELAQQGAQAPAPPPLEAPSREASSDEALADTLEASRDVMQRAMAELDEAPSPSAPPPTPDLAGPRRDKPDPKTLPVASLAPDRASLGGASWQGDLSLPSEERAKLGPRVEGPRELGGATLDPAPPALKTTHWVLVGAIVLVFVGALLLAVAYFALLR